VILVVADTSPLNYLIQIHCQEVLSRLYQRVLIPSAVFGELNQPQTPRVVREWLNSRPPWLEVKEVSLVWAPDLSMLDAGEREAIQLAREEHADLLLMDERMGVRFAQP
jgi:predicted nucleic acid-binding protein